MTESAADDYLRQLNDKLREHIEFEEGMEFLDVNSLGFHLSDPRLRQLQLGQREHDFSDAPFVAAIRAVSTGKL